MKIYFDNSDVSIDAKDSVEIGDLVIVLTMAIITDVGESGLAKVIGNTTTGIQTTKLLDAIFETKKNKK